jgi:hypothetical protein
MNSNQKGAIAEAALALAAAKLGLGILRPQADERYDLVFDLRPRLLRVQSKSGQLVNGVIQVRTSGSWYSPGRGYIRSTYCAAEVDALGVYCPELDRCYLVPIGLVGGQRTLHLRVDSAQNNQKAALHWAANYELPGL